MARAGEAPERWIAELLLPLVAGGAAHVRGPLGPRELEALARAGLDDTAAGRRLSESRAAVVAELLGAAWPTLDDEAFALAAALQNLLFLSHPAAEGWLVRRARLEALADWTIDRLEALPPPDGARSLVSRHSLTHQLFQLGRDDVRVSFWAGRREYRGSAPPDRLLAWKGVRRVREERWRVLCVTEAMGDPLARRVVLALLAASPLTDLLELGRLDPPLRLAAHGRWLGELAVGRLLVDRWLARGLHVVGPPLVAALLALYGERGEPEAARRWTRLFAHLHLCTLLGAPEGAVAGRALPSGVEAPREVLGLYAAAHRVGLGAPADLDRDRRLAARVAAYAGACTEAVSPQRLRELESLILRATDGAVPLAQPA